jgi:2-polyprenyl-6-methoxyphenol hydroxylase-like FAD-dependent oxidoreductase
LYPRYDVVIAGARCAGASTALLLAREGARVLVVDPLPRGRDTLSTHALMRGGVLQLHRWGVLDAVLRAGTPAIRVTTFDYGDETVAVPIKARDGVDALYAPRRTVLDPILAEAAERAGAHVVHGLSLVDVMRDGDGRVRGAWVAGPDGTRRPVSAGLVIGADGARSRVARLVGARVRHEASHTTASIYGYWRGVDRDDNRWYFRPGMGMGTIPTNDGATCVFASMTPAAFAEARGKGLEKAFHALVRRADPELDDMLTGAAASGDLRAFAGKPGFLREPVGPGWALVGDAGYFRDPLTAHGITDALRDAELLARAVIRGGDAALEAFREARDRAARGVMDVTDRIASLSWSMEEVKALHHRLSREMNVGIEVVRDFEVRRSPAA